MSYLPTHITPDAFDTLLRQLQELKAKADAYLDPLPAEVSTLLVTNAYAEAHYAQLSLLGAAAFGDAWPDVDWFLNEWRPGFTITVRVGTPEQHEYTLHSLEDYLAYAHAELFAPQGASPGSPKEPA